MPAPKAREVAALFPGRRYRQIVRGKPHCNVPQRSCARRAKDILEPICRGGGHNPPTEEQVDPSAETSLGCVGEQAHRRVFQEAACTRVPRCWSPRPVSTPPACRYPRSETRSSCMHDAVVSLSEDGERCCSPVHFRITDAGSRFNVPVGWQSHPLNAAAGRHASQGNPSQQRRSRILIASSPRCARRVEIAVPGVMRNQMGFLAPICTQGGFVEAHGRNWCRRGCACLFEPRRPKILERESAREGWRRRRADRTR